LCSRGGIQGAAAGEAPAEARRPRVIADEPQLHAARECWRRPVFWVLYVMFVMVSASGLMATAQIALIAKRFSRRPIR